MSAHSFSISSTQAALALANHLWQSTIVLGIIALLTLTLRQTSARIRYWLWLTASLKFLIPFSLLITLGGHLASLRPAQHHVQANTASFLAIDQISQPFTIDTIPTQTTPTAAPQISLTARAAALWNRSPILPATLASLWLIGFLAVLTRWTHRWSKISAAIRLTHPLHAGPELETLRRMEHLAGLPSRIEMRSLPASMEPGIFGLLHPVLLWPHAITARLDDAHLEAVLAHEVCHVQRRDNLTAGLHMVVEAIFWFHPLVWWLETRLVEEREHACDETVLELCGQRTIYAESILKVCEFCIESPLACVSGVTGADLKKRIVQIMTERTIRKLTLGKKLLLAATALIAITIPILSGQARAMQRLSSFIDTAPRRFIPAALVEPAVIEPVAEAKPNAQDTETPDATNGPAFEVATIRPATREGREAYGFHLTPSGRFTVSALTLNDLVGIAYAGLRGDGGPKWIDSEVFDITAKVDDADTAGWDKLSESQRVERVRPMLRTLLAQRFHLKLRMEMHDTPVYALVQAKGGAKLTPANMGKAVTDQQAENHGSSDKIPGKAQPGNYLYNPSENTWTGNAAPMDTIAAVIGNTGLDLMVVDQTGLKGNYDFTLKISRDKDGPTIPQQVEDQLGLKLESRKLPMKTHVIESADKPSLDGAEVPQSAPQPPTPQSPDQLAPMAKDANPSFEVATIKPSKPDNGSQGFHLRGHHVFLENESVTSMISVAYGIHKTQIIGAPAWFDTDPYDIDGVPDAPGEPTMHQMQQMIQKLLADRFAIKFHHEKRELSIYAITIAKGGIKMTPNTTDREGQPDETGNGHGWQQTMKFTNNTMSDLALELQFQLGKPAIDQTGLTGRYDFTLTFTTNDAHLDDPNAPPGFFTAIQEQLGLKLEPKKAQADVLVIDHAERPSEN